MKLAPGWYGLLALIIISLSTPALAQFQPRPTPGAGATKAKPEKEEGPAEAAPDKDEEEPELPPIPPWPGEETKKVQLFELHGYFRFRADLFHNLNLGQVDRANARAPFYTPLVENAKSSVSCARRVTKPVPGGTVDDRGLDAGNCPDNTLAGANIRLRLEPTINVSEKIKIHMQVDIFDNLVMGTTPEGLRMNTENPPPYVPMIAFSATQVAPIVGRNTNRPAILIKRAWAEVMTPVGQLRFGRMPSNFGMGLLANDGSCLDCDYGDNADRILFATKLFDHILAFGYDFAASGPTSFSVSSGRTMFDGQAVDLEQLDDVDQLFWVVARRDPEEVIEDRVRRGELVLNYGMYFVWRKQDFDYAKGLGVNSSASSLATGLIERSAWAVIPDLWFKLRWRKLSIEAEGVLIAGKIGDPSTAKGGNNAPLDILQFGWVLRSSYKFFRDTITVHFEAGMASGDQAEQTDLNRRRILVLQQPRFNDNAVNEFRFDPDYHVDLILFREIFTTVANAIYMKPSITWEPFESLGGRLDLIYSLAHKPVAYPGNSPHLGVELDLDLYYRNTSEGFYAGVQYGILFPLAGLDRPASVYLTGSDENAQLAQTLQARLIVKF